ncbi:hypothetical protein [Kitasatospora viridis]|uniref:Integral membrane protein n=1 Tax=Kitasatospora viridis TaxID=281105 RepID=A0A561UGZ2_9ACTN|nr:hypothetical protein [Kitasatospora viridis]TWF98627.1 hypothetical protein FHX73_112448 [Kitasatospora viridis]
MSSHRPAATPGAAEPAPRRFGVPAPRGAGWDLRLLRAVPFAAVCTLIAALGHHLAQGCPVAPRTVALGFTAVLLPSAALGGRERSLAGIAGALGIGQLGLHLLFHTVGQAATAGTGGLTLDQLAGRLVCNDMPGMRGMLPPGTDPAALVGAAGLDPHAVAAAAPMAHGPWWLFGLTPAMLLGHLLAAVVAGWWLRCGEAALWRLVRSAGRAARELTRWTAPLYRALALLAALLRGLTAERPRPVRRRPERHRLPVAVVLRHSVVRRGPPAAAWAR